MAGLVGYDSSDDSSGDEQPQIQPSPTQKSAQPHSQPSQPAEPTPSEPTAPEPKAPSPAQDAPAPGAAPPPLGAVPLGPSLPPMDTSAPGASLPEPDDLSASGTAPASPYTTTRSLLHDLTLPSIPNFDIPPSPPSSPSPAAAATNAKFAQFLALKKKGTHFNAKLEQSAALRNPALTDKLLQFVDVGELAEQYQTTLGEEVWNPKDLPAWATRMQLRRGRDKVAKERERERAAPGRSSVDFVPGATTGGGGAGAGLSRGEKRKSGWQ